MVDELPQVAGQRAESAALFRMLVLTVATVIQREALEENPKDPRTAPGTSPPTGTNQAA